MRYRKIKVMHNRPTDNVIDKATFNKRCFNDSPLGIISLYCWHYPPFSVGQPGRGSAWKNRLFFRIFRRYLKHEKQAFWLHCGTDCLELPDISNWEIPLLIIFYQKLSIDFGITKLSTKSLHVSIFERGIIDFSLAPAACQWYAWVADFFFNDLGCLVITEYKSQLDRGHFSKRPSLTGISFQESASVLTGLTFT